MYISICLATWLNPVVQGAVSLLNLFLSRHEILFLFLSLCVMTKLNDSRKWFWLSFITLNIWSVPSLTLVKRLIYSNQLVHLEHVFFKDVLEVKDQDIKGLVICSEIEPVWSGGHKQQRLLWWWYYFLSLCFLIVPFISVCSWVLIFPWLFIWLYPCAWSSQSCLCVF